jgi:hypothetical protein
MALPTQGGLGQASANQQKPPVQAGGKFDVDAVQAENLEKVAKPSSLRDVVSDELGDQREALNSALVRMRESLDSRKNRLFDPVLMQTAAGFLKPTKTGSFGESLGYAAENAGAAAEREMLHEKENQKLEMELLAKEQELRRQMGGDQFMSRLITGNRSTAPAPAGGAVTTPTGALRIPGTASPVDVATAGKAPTKQQIVDAALDGRLQITDEVLALANSIDPKNAVLLEKIRRLQIDEDKNAIEAKKFAETGRKVTPTLMKTERDMNMAQQAEYQKAIDELNATGNVQGYYKFLASKGWLDFDQARAYKFPKTPDEKSDIPSAESTEELAAKKESLTATAKARADAAEKMASRLGLQAEAAFDNTNIANDMIGYAKNNPNVFSLMNKPGLGNAIARAVEQGASVGNFNVSLPASVVLQYKLEESDLAALQMFMQKSAQLQSRGRQLNRTPGEGSTSDYETKLLGGIYALPSDSQRAIILKSDALKMQGVFDEARFKLWLEKRDQPGYSYDKFMVDDDYKALKSNYRSLLDKTREENLDLLSPKKKDKAPAVPAPAAPPASAPATTPPTSKVESPLERFKREKAERDKKAQGTS